FCGQIGPADGAQKVPAKLAEWSASSGDRVEQGQDHPSVASHCYLIFGVLLSTQGNVDFVAGAEDIVILNGAHLRNGNWTTYAKLVVAELPELDARPCRQDLFQAGHGKLSGRRGRWLKNDLPGGAG